MPTDPKPAAPKPIDTIAARPLMCAGCGLTFRALTRADRCPHCFPQPEPTTCGRTTRVAPSVPAAASGHLYLLNRRAIGEQRRAIERAFIETREPKRALYERIVDRIAAQRLLAAGYDEPVLHAVVAGKVL